MAVATHLLCLVAVVLAFANVAASQSLTMPQSTTEDIHIPLGKTPCYPCSFCSAVQIPFVGPLALNLSFTSDTRINIATRFLGRDIADCNGVQYLYDKTALELVFPKQSTDCVVLLALSYIEPLSRVAGLDSDLKSVLGMWFNSYGQCAGKSAP